MNKDIIFEYRPRCPGGEGGNVEYRITCHPIVTLVEIKGRFFSMGESKFVSYKEYKLIEPEIIMGIACRYCGCIEPNCDSRLGYNKFFYHRLDSLINGTYGYRTYEAEEAKRELVEAIERATPITITEISVSLYPNPGCVDTYSIKKEDDRYVFIKDSGAGIEDKPLYNARVEMSEDRFQKFLLKALEKIDHMTFEEIGFQRPMKEIVWEAKLETLERGVRVASGNKEYGYEDALKLIDIMKTAAIKAI